MLVVLFMNAKKHVLYATLLLFSPAIAAWNPFEVAQTGTTSPRAELVLTLELNKVEFALYEPVTVSYRVDNPTSEAIRANVVLNSSAGNIRFFITGPTQKITKYRSRLDAHVAQTEIDHNPGVVSKSEVDLDWSSGRKLAFPVAGGYDIHARLWVGNDPEPVYLESNRLQIQVRDPSKVDTAAIEFFDSEESFQRLLRDGARKYCEGRSGSDCVAELMQFIEEHGASAYAPGIVRSLAWSVRLGFIEVESQSDFAAGYRQFLEQWPNHPNTLLVMYDFAKTLDLAGRYNEARRIILDFERQFPEEKEKAISLRNLQSGRSLAPK